MIITLITVALILAILLVVAYNITKYATKNDPTLKNETSTYTNEELENIKAAEASYNKPIVTEELTVQEPEFIKPETIENIIEISKASPEDTKINLEVLIETPKPTKKKRKYYPKKTK